MVQQHYTNINRGLLAIVPVSHIRKIPEKSCFILLFYYICRTALSPYLRILGKTDMTDNKDPIVISCNIVEKEIRRLMESGRLKADLTFLSSKLHYDYSLLEKALRRTIEKSLDCGQKNIAVIYGDVCLGFKYEMKELVDTYGIVKVDAINCIDCLFGGKGQLFQTDPEHKYFFLTPEWINFWNKFEKSGENLKERYAMLEGIVLLDTLGDIDDYGDDIKTISSATGLPILEKKNVGLQGLQDVIEEALSRMEHY